MRRFGGKCGVGEKPERSKAIVGGHYYQARTGKRWPQQIALTVPGTIRAAMKEDDYGLFVRDRYLPGPNIQEQTVFAPMRVGQPGLGKLRTGRPEVCSISHTGPRGNRLRWLPAQLVRWWRGIRHTEKCCAVLVGAESGASQRTRLQRHCGSREIMSILRAAG